MSSSWWERKLANPQPTRQPSHPPAAPAPPPRLAPVPQQTVQQSQQVHLTEDNFVDAAQSWQGGEASKKELQTCPNCGSNLYFSRSNSGGMVAQSGVVNAAPRCYECGFMPGRQMQGVPPA
jgi:hypothetical protein